LKAEEGKGSKKTEKGLGLVNPKHSSKTLLKRRNFIKKNSQNAKGK